MKLLASTLFLLLAFLDLEFTKRKIAEYGVEVELNPIIKWLVKRLNVNWGTSLGLLIPTGIFVVAGWYQPHILSFMLGVRFFLFLEQVRTINGN